MEGTIEIVSLTTGKPSRIDLSRSILSFEGKEFIPGGQGRLYHCVINDLEAVLKVMPDFTPGARDIFRRMKKVRSNLDRFSRIEPAVFAALEHRGFPIGQGTASGNLFGFLTAKDAFLLAYRYIDGPMLKVYLAGEQPLSKKRIRTCVQVVSLLTVLQDAGLVHSDLYPDNFIVDKSRGDLVLPMDLEGAGVKSSNGWDFTPTVIGKDYWYPLPPEMESHNGTLPGLPDVGSDTWIGTALVFWILTGYQPFEFLTRADDTSMAHLLRLSRPERTWPPMLLKDIMFENPHFTIKQMALFMEKYFRGCGLGAFMYSTYISFYYERQKRPRFSILRELVKGLL